MEINQDFKEMYKKFNIFLRTMALFHLKNTKKRVKIFKIS